MKSIIYYFTGTGNSFVIARQISLAIDSKLVSIPKEINKGTLTTNAETVGFVFPVYHKTIPYIVKRFLENFNDLRNKYIFAVCTYGDSPCLTLKHLNNLIKSKGGELAGGFGVQMPYNYINPTAMKNFFSTFSLRNLSEEKAQRMFRQADVKTSEITQYVNKEKYGRVEVTAKIIEGFVDILNIRDTLLRNVWFTVAGYTGLKDRPFIESIGLMDYGFWSNDNCVSCKVCSNICPVNNIRVIDKPQWQHNCEQCFACLQWCPTEAIQFREGTAHGKRYHHPEVTLSDMKSSKE